jgi:asparagine synthase (glutamine-hydrolysing)
MFEYVRELLTEEAVSRSGLFNSRAVAQLVNKAASGAALSENDEMAVVGIISTQLLDQQFVRDRQGRRATLRPIDNVKVVNLSL